MTNLSGTWVLNFIMKRVKDFYAFWVPATHVELCAKAYRPTSRNLYFFLFDYSIQTATSISNCRTARHTLLGYELSEISIADCVFVNITLTRGEIS